jgi:bifunctional DNA-binding transcriptional regulator/antitoxin component of YhaV-PrlF toxin-antitoxin module
METRTKEIMKHVDEQGRVVIPKKWRNEYLKDSSTVILQIRDGEIIMKSHQPVDITKYFNSLDADIEADLDNWDDVKRELLKKKPS